MVGGGGCVAVGTLARPQGTSSWSHLLPGSCFAPAGPLGLRERLGAPRDEFFYGWESVLWVCGGFRGPLVPAAAFAPNSSPAFLLQMRQEIPEQRNGLYRGDEIFPEHSR